MKKAVNFTKAGLHIQGELNLSIIHCKFIRRYRYASPHSIHHQHFRKVNVVLQVVEDP
jgi:hypothetical protein